MTDKQDFWIADAEGAKAVVVRPRGGPRRVGEGPRLDRDGRAGRRRVPVHPQRQPRRRRPHDPRRRRAARGPRLGAVGPARLRRARPGAGQEFPVQVRQQRRQEPRAPKEPGERCSAPGPWPFLLGRNDMETLTRTCSVANCDRAPSLDKAASAVMHYKRWKRRVEVPRMYITPRTALLLRASSPSAAWDSLLDLDELGQIKADTADSEFGKKDRIFAHRWSYEFLPRQKSRTALADRPSVPQSAGA
jgi:hypothetical protein